MATPPAHQPQHNFKVVLLGEGCVGKTSLVCRYVKNVFNENHVTTIQASFLSKKINVDQKRVQLAIWDTAGQERFHALGPIYYRDSNGALLVYDVTDHDSFLKVKNWVKELRRMLGTDVVLAIAGNKIDLEKQRSVSAAEAEEFAEAVGARHFVTSAKLNRGVDELFLDLTKRLLAANPTPPGGGGLGSGGSGMGGKRGLAVIDDSDPAAQQHLGGGGGGGGGGTRAGGAQQSDDGCAC